MPVIPASCCYSVQLDYLGRLESHKFETSLGNLVRPCLKTKAIQRTGWVVEVAQKVKVLAIKPDLGLIPRTHLVEGENQFPQIVL